ncbi:MAG: DUF2971 domain-containing protein [Oscillospiraceae bacterium]|nr:DUF2971 domain-containing protein [Oscillospiraceae bacterium]
MEKNLNDSTRELERYKGALQEGWEDDFAQVFELAQRYFAAEDYANAISYYTKVTELNPEHATSYNNIGAALAWLGKKKDVINLYLKSLELDKEDSVVFSNLIRQAMWQKKIPQTVPQMLDKPSRYTWILEHIKEYADAVATPHKAKYFQIFDDMEISDDCDDYEKYFWVKYIFENTKGHTAIRAYLIAFYAVILEIKHSLILKEIEGKSIGHYTRIESIKYLVAKEQGNENRFRLNNAAYMNDPSEGHVFLDLLSHVLKGQVLSNYFSTENETGVRQAIHDSDTYLGSFSTNIDSLPLWVQYGNNGQGCCLVFDSNCFDKEGLVTPEQMKMQTQPLIEVGHTEKEEQAIAPKYCLYQVIYTDSIEALKESEPSIYAPLEKVSKLLTHIDREMKKIHDPGIKEELRRIVVNAVDQIRFLFKNTDYAHEHELRIVISSNQPTADAGNRSREIPHLYMEMDKELIYDEIILGPKVEKPSEVAPYIYYTKKAKAVTKSTIKYQ